MKPSAIKVCVHQLILCSILAVSISRPVNVRERYQPTNDQTSHDGLGHVNAQSLNDESGHDDAGNQ